MPDKAPKAKAKPRASANGVLGSLPSTRPDRLGAPRNGTPAPRRRPAPAAEHGAAKPRAVRSGAPELKTRASAKPAPPEPLGAPTGTELVTTAIRATGELAQIGLLVGGRMLKRTLGRLPRP